LRKEGTFGNLTFARTIPADGSVAIAINSRNFASTIGAKVRSSSTTWVDVAKGRIKYTGTVRASVWLSLGACVSELSFCWGDRTQNCDHEGNESDLLNHSKIIQKFSISLQVQ
jgi:hypothetical protein